jgi:plastocyanin
MPVRSRVLALGFLLALSTAALAAGQTVNGCSFSTATDWFDADATTREIDFTCCQFTPPCVKIEAGDTVKFVGTFSIHPLRAGTVHVAGMTIDPDPVTGIVATSSGSSVTLPFPEAGEDPFYCNNHKFSNNMFGTVFIALFADGFEGTDLCHWALDEPPSGCP